MLMTPLDLVFHRFFFLLEGGDAGILHREVLVARMEGFGVGLLLFEWERRREHDDGDT